MIGATIAAAGGHAVLWKGLVSKVVLPAVFSPVIAALVAATGTYVLYRISRRMTAGARSHGFRIGQIGSACMVSLAICFLIILAALGWFWGAPLVAHEIEARTLPLTWNQSVTKTRWLAVKLGLVGLGSVATAGLLSLMLTWWSSPMDSTLEIPYGHRLLLERLGPVLFATRGLAPLGYAAFAFALGVTAGMLTRRTVSAMAATLGVFAALQFAWAEWIRAHLVPPVTVIVPLNPGNISVLGIKDGFMTLQAAPALTQQGAWILSGQVIDTSGHPAQVPAIPACLSASSQGCAGSLARFHFRELISYEPASRFWTFQWVETGIFVALAVALAACCVWWLIRRIA